MTLRSPHKITQRRGSIMITGPASEPVSASQLRTHLADDGLNDADAELLIQEAREFIEQTYNLAIVTQTWRVAFDSWPCSSPEWWDGIKQGSVTDLYRAGAPIELPRWPVQSVASVKVYDINNNAELLTPDDYFYLDTYRNPVRMVLRDGKTLPVATRSTNAIEIDYVAGYTTVPAAIKKAVLIVAAYLYTNRGDCGIGSADVVKASGAASLLSVYSTVRV